MGFRVQGILGSDFRDSWLGFRVSGFPVRGFGYGFSLLGIFNVGGFEVRDRGVDGFRGFGWRVSWLRVFRASRSGVSGSGL